jgi:exopolyphosphatase/pppGpp-phosphohydrolase
VLGAVTVTISGPHALVLACVELGADSVPEGYTLARTDADEVFRTLVAEPVSERLHNPGLQPDHVESIIGTCCVVLAVMRRLELSLVAVEPQES